MQTAGRQRLEARLVKLAPRIAGRLAASIIAALGEQTVVVTGTHATSQVLPQLAEQLAPLRRQRGEIATQVEELVDAHPLFQGPDLDARCRFRTAAVILVEVSGKNFTTAGHLPPTPGWPQSPADRAPRSDRHRRDRRQPGVIWAYRASKGYGRRGARGDTARLV